MQKARRRTFPPRMNSESRVATRGKEHRLLKKEIVGPQTKSTTPMWEGLEERFEGWVRLDF